MTTSDAPRETCLRCRRPARYCWCAHLTAIETRTRVLLLQHPRERDVPIGTARMASLCLPNSELHVGIHWGEHGAVQRALRDPSRPTALLFPGADARDVTVDPPREDLTLVVVDGTWTNARKVVQANPTLAALPRLSITPAEPSQYRIRREPAAQCVSTIEALVYVLGALEGDVERFRPMLTPFRAMIDAQVACAETQRNGRMRKPRGARPPKEPVTAPLRAAKVVCVAAEGNVWPHEPGVSRAPELIHLAAVRLDTGERFEAVARPEGPLAPGTPRQTGLDASSLTQAPPRDAMLRAWTEFLRDDDVLCMWGDHPAALLDAAGAPVPSRVIDLRVLARVMAHGRVGTATEFLASRGVTVDEAASLGVGRAGRRLAHAVAVAQHLAQG